MENILNSEGKEIDEGQDIYYLIIGSIACLHEFS